MSDSEHLVPYRMTPEDARVLRSSLARQPEIIPFSEEPRLAALVASLGIHREVGTLNDEMARFVFDAETGEEVPRSALKSELVVYHGETGVRIWAEGHPRLDLRFRGIRALLHPRFSFDPDGGIKQCVIFPSSIAKIIAGEEGEVVLVRPWGMNTVFGGFDSDKHYYQTNFWELENNDTLRFARLVEKRRIPFLGTHDVVAHLAGVKGDAWESLTREGARVREILEDYFRTIRTPTVASLVLPYTAGVLLDDLAQPPNYGAPGRGIVIEEVLSAIGEGAVPPAEPRVLLRFPSAYESCIRLARDEAPEAVHAKARPLVRALVNEILEHSALVDGGKENRGALDTTARRASR